MITVARVNGKMVECLNSWLQLTLFQATHLYALHVITNVFHLNIFFHLFYLFNAVLNSSESVCCEPRNLIDLQCIKRTVHGCRQCLLMVFDENIELQSI